MILYLSLALLASSLMALGLLMMKSRSTYLPAATGANVIGALVAWLSDPMWFGGLCVQTAGWACYVIAVSHAPVSMVAVMMQGGIALFVVASVVILGERASPREWVGITAIVFGMLMLTLSLNGARTIADAFEPGTLLIFTALLIGAGLAPMAVARLNASGAAAAILSGVAFGLGAMFTKSMTLEFSAGAGAVGASNRDQSVLLLHARRKHLRHGLAAKLVSLGARDNRDAAVGSAVEHRTDHWRHARVRRTIARRLD